MDTKLVKRLMDAGWKELDRKDYLELGALVEACDGKIFSILNLNKTDGAHQEQVDAGYNWGVAVETDSGMDFSYGVTIEESVAEAWLKINKKQ